MFSSPELDVHQTELLPVNLVVRVGIVILTGKCRSGAQASLSKLASSSMHPSSVPVNYGNNINQIVRGAFDK